MSYSLFLLFVIIRSILCSNKVIKVPFFNDKNTPRRIIVMKHMSAMGYNVIDISYQYTWILGRLENILTTEPITILNETALLNYDFNPLKGKEIKSTFTLLVESNITIDFTFFVIGNNLYNYQGPFNVIGLASSFFDNKYSFIHQLKAQGYIDHISFSFCSDGNDNDNSTGKLLIIGGISNEVIDNQVKAHCNIIGHNRNWDCYIDRVIVFNSDNRIALDYRFTEIEGNYGQFNSIDEYIYTPSDFMRRLGRLYFNDLIQEKKCLEYGNRNKSQICCPKEYIPSGNITFVINDSMFNFFMSDFWECSSMSFSCRFLLVQNPLGDYWKLGMSFMSKLNIHFNYEEKRIDFYSLSHIAAIKSSAQSTQSHHQLLAILCLNLSILSLGTCILMIMKKIQIK